MGPLTPTHCTVCDKILPLWQDARQPPCCTDASCRLLLAQRAQLGEFLFQHQVSQGRARARERAEEARAVAARAAAEGAESERAFAALRAQRGTGPGVLETVLPSGPRRTRPVSARRRAAYEAHLRAVVAEAFVEPPPSAPPPAPAGAPALDSRLPERLCTACGGGCCTAGKEHAYLIPASIQRLRFQDPSLQPEQIVQFYLRHIPAQACVNSCVNQTRQGCALPREWRSDTCNTWACKPLQTLYEGLQTEPRVHTVRVLRRRQDQWTQTLLQADNGIVARAELREDALLTLRAPRDD
ncbi:hypothetical protein [Inhella proteolytica]|uniref:Uncharacterized protein n=1 Tax=Inhella proteolytica TaxID=2795029 RepID=A0A931J046_9BURK|nr:hypothetical protein [Inhella proteolytica]MBH9577014.1 hypothetical protein [Inhella proteolytica]